MDSDDIARALGFDGVDGVYEAAIEQIATSAEGWMEDTPTHQAARMVIGSLRPFIELLHEGNLKEVNRLVLTVVIKQYMATLQHIQVLDQLTELRRSSLGDSSDPRGE